MGLQFNIDKTKYMELKNKEGSLRKQNLSIKKLNGNKDVLEFEEVENYMYLGVLVTNKCEEDSEIDLRIAKSNNCAGGLNKILRSKEVSRNTKFRIYKSVLKPTLTFGCETWVMNQKNQWKIEAWERKILRRILGGRNTVLGWERRMNTELYELYGEKSVGVFVKYRRLQWLGHLVRMEEGRNVKDVAWKKPEGKRKKGRPRNRWIQAVEKDLEEKRIRNWRELARDRKKWKDIASL